MNDGNRPHKPGAAIDWASALARHDRWLRTVVGARLGERQAVDEVLQEVSLSAVGSKAIVDPTRIAGFLYRLAIRQTLLYRRSMGRRHRLTGRYADRVRDEGSASTDPLGWLLLDERLAMVREGLARLPVADREQRLRLGERRHRRTSIADRTLSASRLNAIDVTKIIAPGNAATTGAR